MRCEFFCLKYFMAGNFKDGCENSRNAAVFVLTPKKVYVCQIRCKAVAFLRSPLAFLEKAVPQDAKSAACVKKSVLFERSEFTDFSKLPIWQGFWKMGIGKH